MRGFTKSLIGKLLPLLAMFIVGGVGLTSCSQEEQAMDTSFALYYAGLNEISPGTDITITPTYYGTKPTGFEILAVELNGLPYQTECFVVDAESGAFSLQNTEELPTGKYVVGVACTSDGVRFEYPEAITINMLKPIPDGIFVEPNDLRVEWGDVVETSEEKPLPTAQITTDGNRHVEIKKYAIANVYHNGELNNDCKEWFEVHPTQGVFSIVEDNAAIEPGVYTFDFKLNTYIVGSESEDGIFRNALRVTVTSAPMELTYNPASMLVEVGYAGKSAKPALKGSKDDLVYTLKGVQPNNIGITVDDATGVIRFPENNNIKEGDQFVVSVTATNAYGTKDFDNIFTFNVTSFIFPIEKVVYEDVAEVISGVSINNPVKEVVGSEVTYSLVDVPAGLEALTIDPATGVVSCKKGVELPVGEHIIKVNARNIKGDLTTSFKIKVVPNPFRFTYVEWGNNLGLEPIEDFGAQFRMRAGDADLVVPIVKSDLPEGQPVTFKLVNKTQNSNAKMNASIDKATGTLTIKAADNKDAHHRVHVAILEVTCGGDSEAAVTRLIPLFVDQAGPRNGYIVEYTPFAVRVNPKKGGRSVSPTYSLADGGEANQFTMDYRRNFDFFKLGGPEQHVEGRLSSSTFLYCVWSRFFTAVGKAVNTGACGPMSYYGDKNGENGRLGMVGAYVEPGTLQVVVNGEKFVDDYGYGHGVVIAQMQCNVNNIDPVNGGGKDLFPIIIWLDPSYNK
ncbi:MAG: DUF4958 family protein [Tidjanibacter sp.]|nr:DUF4958 family protein [Tidjanibacter sp.]